MVTVSCKLNEKLLCVLIQLGTLVLIIFLYCIMYHMINDISKTTDSAKSNDNKKRS